jgi:hypothetical protein
MGVFDQAACFATQVEPEALVQRLLASRSVPWRFREWLDTRSLPLPGGADRTADLVMALDDPAAPDRPWLLVLEFQAQVDPDKLDVTLEEVALLRSRARHGEDRQGRYRVLSSLVYLQGRCPQRLLEMTLPDGSGTRHVALVWNVAEDNAAERLEAVAKGTASWGMLFWVPLMAAGAEETVLARWKELATALVPDRHVRGNMAVIALVFAELAGRRIEWKRELEGFEMTESQVVNEWIAEAEVKAILRTRRQDLLELLEVRFPGQAPTEVVQLIQQQDSQDLLNDWFKAALRALTWEQFLAVLKR